MVAAASGRREPLLSAVAEAARELVVVRNGQNLCHDVGCGRPI